ncbi:STAS/SEC14 domain-containing protein [Sorangium sp. So ce429]
MKTLSSGARLELREEPDGILFVAFEGALSDEMARAITAAFQRLSDSGRDVLVLSDARRNESIPPSARKALANGMRSSRLDAVAAFGSSFSVRVIATLTAKSVQLLTQHSYPIVFFDTEAEARAWLLAQRGALRARRPPVA